MNDREMLEYAAKAAGITGKYGHAPDDYYYKGNTEGILICFAQTTSAAKARMARADRKRNEKTC